jgi:hypothetical protein
MGRTACTEPQCLYKGDLYLLPYAKKCYGTSMFITAFTTAHKLSLSWVRLIHSSPLPSYFSKTHFNTVHPPTLKSSTWCLCFMFPPPKPDMYCRSTSPTHLISLDLISRIIPISRPTDATCDRFLFSIYMCITLRVLGVKRSSSGVPHRTYSLQFLELKLF